MIAFCRLSVLSFVVAIVSTDATTVRRKKKHHHHHHHLKHRRHHNASSVNKTRSNASNKDGPGRHNASLVNKTHSSTSNKSTGLNATDGVARPHGLLDTSNPKSSLGAAAVHAAAHAALHRHVPTRVAHVARPRAEDARRPQVASDSAPDGPVPSAIASATEDQRKRIVVEGRSLHERSRNATEPSVALAHTAVHVNASASAEKHPHTHHRQSVASDAAGDDEHNEEDSEAPVGRRGEMLVGGPLPPDFEDRFVEGVAEAAHVPAEAVRVLSVGPAESAEGADIDTVVFTAPKSVVQLAEDEAGDPGSPLANGPLHAFLVDHDGGDDTPALDAPEADAAPAAEADAEADAPERRQSAEEPRDAEQPRADEPPEAQGAAEADAEAEADAPRGGEGPRAAEAEAEADAPRGGADAPPAPEEEPPPDVHAGGRVFDVDSEMPYGDLEPFGREDTATELTGSSIRESDQMVDQLERAEVAEEKRAVFRALTRLRGAAITSFDGIARAQTGNIDEYNKRHRWRDTHPLHHLADEESDVAKWAFPEDC